MGNEHRDIAKIAMRPTGLGNTGTRGEALWLLPAQPVAATKPLCQYGQAETMGVGRH